MYRLNCTPNIYNFDLFKHIMMMMMMMMVMMVMMVMMIIIISATEFVTRILQEYE